MQYKKDEEMKGCRDHERRVAIKINTVIILVNSSIFILPTRPHAVLFTKK
jgi:hypothetical protein